MRCFVRQVNGNYHASFDCAGKSYTQSLRTQDEQEAEARIGQIRDSLYRLELGTLQTAPGVDVKASVLSSGNLTQQQQQVAPLTVSGLADKFIDSTASYYVKDGMPTSQVLITQLAVKVLRERYGRTPALSFGPLALKECREQFIKLGLARTECNRRTRIIVQAFRWGVENELIPAVHLEALKAVRGLPKGRSSARETELTRLAGHSACRYYRHLGHSLHFTKRGCEAATPSASKVGRDEASANEGAQER